MIYYPAFLLLLIFLSFFAQSNSQPVSDQTLHQLLLQGIDCSGKQKYSEAKKIFDRCIVQASQHPGGYLNKAILLEVMSLDFETPVPQPEFNTLLEKSEQLSTAMLDKNPKSSEALYYLGMTHSYIAYYKFRDGKNWFSGLQHGFKAAGYLEDCITIDPKAYDAYTGVGTYKYWKSKKMSFLTWTPFVSDERDVGIKMLRKAEQNATYTKAQATNSLMWIFIEEKRYGEAEAAARSELKKYPNNRLFSWGLASTAEKQKKWNVAREAYQTILQSLDGEVPERRYIEIQTRAKIAKMSYELKDYKTAKQECDWVIANSHFDTSGFTNDGAERIKRRIDEVKKIREKLQ